MSTPPGGERPDPRKLARAGYGREDLMVKCGITEAEARFYVFGKMAMQRQEKVAS